MTRLSVPPAVSLPSALAFCLLSSSATSASLDGRFAVEMEYLSESYFREQTLSGSDLDLPADTPLLISETTRFVADSWLPGQRLELNLRHQPARDSVTRLYSRTAFNNQRLSQDFEFQSEFPGITRGRWIFRALGSLREEHRSLVGHGDWRARVEATREVPLGGSRQGSFRVGWEHSRTRGDTTSYLYDFDLLRARVRVSGGEGWLPGWEARVEGVTKAVPREEPGGYEELRVAGAWRSRGGDLREITVEGRVRDYGVDGNVGRDLRGAEVYWRERSLMGSPLDVETRWTLTDYRGADELYYDASDLLVHLPWQVLRSEWTVSAGPAARLLWDLNRLGRDFRQWSARVGVNGIFATRGFGDLSLEAGYRDYVSDISDMIEISSLSSAVLRSDYWLAELLLLANLPLWGGLTFDVLASSSWELHAQEEERIQVTLVTMALARGF